MPRSVLNCRTEPAVYPTTEDSRFHAENNRSAQRLFFGMYSGNIAAEADGLGYSELNILRALFFELSIQGLLVLLSNLEYSRKHNIHMSLLLRYLSWWYEWSVGFWMIVFKIPILLVELVVWPIRFVLGIFLDGVSLIFSGGQLYELKGAFVAPFACTTRRIKVRNLVPCRITTIPIFCLGKVLWFETSNQSDASYIVSVLKLQQRCGTGPEGILLDGTNVFVSWWRPWTLTSLVCGNKISWDP